jgi:hypothetical protein
MSHRVVCASTTLLFALAGAAASAQDGPLPPTMEQVTTDIYGNTLTAGPYQSRAIGTVFENGYSFVATASANGSTVGVNHIIEDFDLTGGPLANAPVKRITAIGFTTVSSNVAACTPPQVYDCLIEVFSEDACDYTSPEMISPTAVPLWSVRSAFSQNCNTQTLRTINLAPNGVGGANDVSFVLPTNRGFIRLRNVNQGTTTLRNYPGFNGQTQVQGFGFCTGLGSNLVGTVTPGYGRDLNGDGSDRAFPFDGTGSGLLGGSPVIVGAGAGAHEHRRTISTAITALRMKLDGELFCPAPTSVALGALANGQTTHSSTLAAGETKWYSFDVGAVNDASLTYLDIDTESSTADLTIGLYDATGTRISFDNDDGSGLLPHLSYGIGRRGAAGDGRDYDGRDGQLVAGTYYLGVGGSQASFQICYNVPNSSTETGDVTVRLRTNASPGGATAPEPSVAPTIAGVNDFGTVVSPGFQTTDVAAGPLSVTWYRFSMGETTNDNTWFDLDTSNSAGTGNDPEIAVYDSNGLLVATDDDDGMNDHSSLSFGAASAPRPPRPPVAGATSGLPFDGRDGHLAAGQYYVAVALFNMLPANDRWHVRTNSGSNLGVMLTATTNSDGIPDVTCPGNECGSQDYNGDGDFGTDQDIEAFFACLGGNCCPTCFCQGSDFNGDGDFGTDQDIEAFFRVLGGGNC